MFEPSNTKQIGQVRWLRVTNAYAGTIPAFAAVKVTGSDASGVLTVTQPDAFNQDVLLNGPMPIAQGSTGVCTWDAPNSALYDPGTCAPNNGESWGAQAGSFLLGPRQTGFRAEGGAGTGCTGPGPGAALLPGCRLMVVRGAGTAAGTCSTTTTTTTTATCGTCTYGCNTSLSPPAWQQTSGGCTGGCSCIPPPAGCVASCQSAVVPCGTASTSTTTTTTPPCECQANFVFGGNSGNNLPGVPCAYLCSGGVWTKYIDLCQGNFYCCCCPTIAEITAKYGACTACTTVFEFCETCPTTTTTTTSTTTTSTTTCTTTTAPGMGTCGTCSYQAIGGTGGGPPTWSLTFNGCFGGCGCTPPLFAPCNNPFNPSAVATTNCAGGGSTTSTTTTTTTTICGARTCSYLSDGTNWILNYSDCFGSCRCPAPIGLATAYGVQTLFCS